MVRAEYPVRSSSLGGAEMKGLRIHDSSPAGGICPYAGSSFAYFFAPILPRLSALHWLYQSWPFDTCDRADNRDAGARFPDNNGYVAPDTLLPRLAEFVNDDWSSLFGFDSAPDAEVVFAHLEPRDYEFMERHIPHCFFSIDGAYWDFYSHDEALLEIVRIHLVTLPGVHSEEVDFIDFKM